MGPWLPENVSTFGADIDGLFYLILGVTGVVFVVVEVALVYFLWKYRGKEGRRAQHTHGNMKAEIIWTLVPLILVAMLGFMSRSVWIDIKYESRFPQPALELGVVASQFEWHVTYPGPDGQLGSADDFTVRNQLHMPVDQPIRVNLTAEDVIHSFFLPEFRVKQDAVPGMDIPVWFQATRTGQYVLGCAELCGLGHYRMRGSVTVHSAEEFDRWYQQEMADAE